MKETIRTIITERINELKYERLQLRRFIESDSIKIDEIDRAIRELEYVYKQLTKRLRNPA